MVRPHFQPLAVTSLLQLAALRQFAPAPLAEKPLGFWPSDSTKGSPPSSLPFQGTTFPPASPPFQARGPIRSPRAHGRFAMPSQTCSPMDPPSLASTPPTPTA